MSAHTRTQQELERSHHDLHIEILTKDWNEPEAGVEVGLSSVLVMGPCVTVVSPVTMYYIGEHGVPTGSNTVLIGTYFGEQLISVTCVEPTTARIAYAPDASLDQESDPQGGGYVDVRRTEAPTG